MKNKITYKGQDTTKLPFAEFHKARKYLHLLNIKNGLHYLKLRRANKLKLFLPSDLLNHYGKHKDWKGLGDFIGSGTIKNGDKIYRSYEESQKLAKKLKIKTYEQWTNFCKSDKKPIDVPYAAHTVYRKQWKGYGEFFGTGKIPWNKIKYLSLNQMKKIVKPLKLKSRKEYSEWYSKNKPKNFSLTPHYIHKKDWKGWKDFLGDSYKILAQRDYISYREASKLVKKAGIKSQKEFNNWVKKLKMDNFPHSPDNAYKKQWKGWNKFLGTKDRRIYETSKFWTYEETGEYLRKKGIKTSFEFRKQRKNLPKKIPRSPEYFYAKNQTWKGWGMLLGNKKIYKSKWFNWLSFKEAKEEIKKFKIKNSNEWLKFCKTSKKPYNVPTTPQLIYKKEWIDWLDFLGVEKITYSSFKESRRFAQSLKIKTAREWHDLVKKGKIPKHIPKHPEIYYANRS